MFIQIERSPTEATTTNILKHRLPEWNATGECEEWAQEKKKLWKEQQNQLTHAKQYLTLENNWMREIYTTHTKIARHVQIVMYDVD